MISIAITTYNRSDLTIESFSKVYNHPLVSEVVIVDDASDSSIYNDLERGVFKMDKVSLFRNPVNLGMSRNKHRAVCLAKNDWCILFDSDNTLYLEYLESITEFNPKTIYCPIAAEPDYDFSTLQEYITAVNAKHYLDKKEFRVFLNTSNYFVNRAEYLRVYRHDPTIKESDTIYFNYLWLDAGNTFQIVKGMKYHHLRHEGSGWLTGDHKYNLKKAAELQEKIKQL